jgi:hypothetical protein
VRMGQVRAPEKPLDEAFWKLPRAEYRTPPSRQPLEDPDDPPASWELREAV